jgi:hypothetical protein
VHKRVGMRELTCPEAVERVLALKIPDSLCGDGEDGDGKGGQHGLPERSGTSTINETDI